MRSNAKKCLSLKGFHSNMVDGREMGGPKSPPGFPGPHDLMVRPGGLRWYRSIGNVILYRTVKKSNLAIEMRCRQSPSYEA